VVYLLPTLQEAHSVVDVVVHVERESFHSDDEDVAECIDPEEEVPLVPLGEVGEHLLVLAILTRSWIHS
jgi:hypothetical protein